MDLILIYLVVYGFCLVVLGYFLPFVNNLFFARVMTWTISVLTVLFSVIITWNAPPLVRMIAIVLLQLLSMKAVVMVETYRGKPHLNFFQWCAFAIGWFGMRPLLFESLPSKPLQYSRLLWIAISRVITGLLLLYVSQIFEKSNLRIFFLSELVLLVGLSLILHFGILNLSAAFWRSMGVDAKELFRSPYKSKSLKEFWGKRWNAAFSEMTSVAVYRPLKHYLRSSILAILAAFLVSGLLHEIAISFPVHSGYGLPLTYFIPHGLVMYAEGNVLFIKKIIAHTVLSRIWVLGWLIVPMPLLFHTAFISQVLRPLREVLMSPF